MRRHVSQRSSFYKEGRVSGVIPSAVEEPRRMSSDAPRGPSTSLRCARDDELVRLRKEVDAGASRVECWRVQSSIYVSEMPALSKEDKLQLLTTILESRHGDLREQNLNRQGKGHFHVSGMGHEALAAISVQMEPDDYICPYYRDRALVLGRGVASRELALDYMAKRKGQSGGRQMPSHYSYAERHIWR